MACLGPLGVFVVNLSTAGSCINIREKRPQTKRKRNEMKRILMMVQNTSGETSASGRAETGRDEDGCDFPIDIYGRILYLSTHIMIER